MCSARITVDPRITAVEYPVCTRNQRPCVTASVVTPSSSVSPVDVQKRPVTPFVQTTTSVTSGTA